METYALIAETTIKERLEMSKHFTFKSYNQKTGLHDGNEATIFFDHIASISECNIGYEINMAYKFSARYYMSKDDYVKLQNMLNEWER